MNRVFRGALFPIVIVIVLAFFVSKLIPSSAGGQPHDYQTLVGVDIPGKAVESFTVDTSSNAINVTLKNKTKYTVGYDPSTQSTLDTVINEYKKYEPGTRRSTSSRRARARGPRCSCTCSRSCSSSASGSC